MEDAFRNQVFAQVQLTLVFSSAPQRNGLRECDVGQSCHGSSWSGVNACFVSIVKNGQNKSRILGHVNLAHEQGVIVTGKVKDHVVCKEKHTDAQHVKAHS